MSEREKPKDSSILHKFSLEMSCFKLGNEQEALTTLNEMETGQNSQTLQELANNTKRDVFVAEKIGQEDLFKCPNVKVSSKYFSDQQPERKPILLFKKDDTFYYFGTTTKFLEEATIPLICPTANFIDQPKLRYNAQLLTENFIVLKDCGGNGDCGPLSLREGLFQLKIDFPKKYHDSFTDRLDIEKIRKEVVQKQASKGKLFFEDLSYYWNENDLLIASEMLNVPIIVKNQDFEKEKIEIHFYREMKKEDLKRMIVLRYKNNYYQILLKDENNFKREKERNGFGCFDFSGCFSGCFSGSLSLNCCSGTNEPKV